MTDDLESRLLVVRWSFPLPLVPGFLATVLFGQYGRGCVHWMRQHKLFKQQGFIIAPALCTDKMELGLILGRWSCNRCKHQGPCLVSVVGMRVMPHLCLQESHSR